MPPPSKLAIAISSVQRLAKEEKSYHIELEQQEARIKKLEESKSTEENADFQLRQEVRWSSYRWGCSRLMTVSSDKLLMRPRRFCPPFRSDCRVPSRR